MRRYTTRTSSLESDTFAAAKKRLIERGQHFAETSKRARAAIAETGERFIRKASVGLGCCCCCWFVGLGGGAAEVGSALSEAS